MLAQYSSDSGAAAVLGILIVLAVLGLQIYLIYAIIATRQDVRVIRSLLGGPTSTSSPTPGQAVQAADIDRLRQAAELHESGVLSEAEFSRVKDGILGGWVETAAQPEEPRWRPSEYTIVIRDLHGVDPSRVAKIVRSHLSDVPLERMQTTPFVVADGIGFATAEPIRADLVKAGVVVDMHER